jgi:CBS domain-containing protein
MTGAPVCVQPSATIRQLARLFNEHEISGAPVVDPQGRLIGMVSKTDLIRRCAEGIVEVPPAYMYELISEHRGEELELVPEPLVCVDDFMTADPATVSPETPIGEVARLMFERRIHRVVVTDRDQIPVGIITSLDLLGACRGARVVGSTPR